MRIGRFLKQFNWRFLLVRILVNALALAVTAAVTPIYFVDKSVWSWLLMAFVLGVLNALLKPLLQFLTLQFIFVTYGLVIVLVNALILWLLSFLFPARFAVEKLWWALVGGLVLGLLSSFLESLLGLTMPIVPEEAVALRRQLAEEARHADWHALARRETGPESQALALERPAVEANAAAGAAVPGPGVAELGAPESGAAESSAPGPDEGSPPPAVETEPADSAMVPPSEAGAPAEAAVLADAGVSVDPEPAPEPRAEEKEDGS